MALRQDILPYIDGNNLVAPAIVPPGTKRASDNGNLFTSEYYSILNLSGELTDQDRIDFQNRIGACIDQNGLLNRAPVGTDSDLESVDDYYGTINGSFQTQNTNIPRQYLSAVRKYWGFLNNANPGEKNLQSFLIRQPQLLCAMITAAFPQWFNLWHILIRTLIMPLYWISAIVILFGAKAQPINDADSRILGWHLVQVVKNYSLTCKLASWVWYNRLYANYGESGMKEVARIYFQAGHPFIQTWVN